MSKQQVQLTKSQTELLEWLGYEAVFIEHESNGKYYLKKFGLKVRVVSEKTIDAIRPYLQLHKFDSRATYTLNKNFTNG